SPRHYVHVAAFDIAPTTVTRCEYEEFQNGSCREEPKGWHDAAFSNSEQPIVGVNWFDAVAYCEWLSRKTGESFRLPTEAEWEMACRGGLSDMEYAWGDEPSEVFEYFRGQWTKPCA